MKEAKIKLSKGRIVPIFNGVDKNGYYFLEGCAELDKKLKQGHTERYERWQVRFPGEKEVSERFVAKIIPIYCV